MYNYSGAFHIHSTFSDGSGKIPEIIQCAKKAGLNTIRLCHGKPNDKASEYIDYAADNINECLDLLGNLCA